LSEQPRKTRAGTVASGEGLASRAWTNVDTNPNLAASHRITSLPARLVFRDGRAVARHVGVTPEAVWRRELKQLSGPAVHQ
jgi:thioredoxin-like negative regulator of GroEL